jgi:hypothetical protein
MGIKFFRLPLLVALTTLTVFSPAFGDGNSLLRCCLEAERVLDDPRIIPGQETGFCLGMVVGVRDTLIDYDTAYEKSGCVIVGPKMCWPKETITNGQSVRVVVKYLKDNPNQLHQPDRILVRMALKKAFECK